MNARLILDQRRFGERKDMVLRGNCTYFHFQRREIHKMSQGSSRARPPTQQLPSTSPPPFRPPFRLPEARWISTLAALHLKNAESHAKKPVGIFDIQSIFEGSETTLTLLVLLLTPLLLSSLNLQIPEEKKARI